MSKEAIDQLIECARLLGTTQAKVGAGTYTREDSRFESAMYESIAEHRKALEEALKQEQSEIERLTGALKRANSQAEHFGREWYLRGHELEQLKQEQGEPDVWDVRAVHDANAEEPAMNPKECAEDVFKHGTSMGLFVMSKQEAEQYCEDETKRTGHKYDWHYVAGRVHVKALIPTQQRKPLIDALLSEKVIEKAGREWWAQTRRTNGPRTLAQYASQKLMDEVHNTAEIIIGEAIKAAQQIKG